MQANRRVKILGNKIEEESSLFPSVVTQMLHCWRRCQRCEKLRLVQEECLPALDDNGYRCRTEVASTAVDWKNWMDGASDRYGAFVADGAKVSEEARVAALASLEEVEKGNVDVLHI